MTFGTYVAAELFAEKMRRGEKLTAARIAEVIDSCYRRHCAAHRRPHHPEVAEGNVSPVFLALCRAELSNPAELTDQERRRIGIAESQIRRAMPGRSDDEIAGEVASRAAKYKVRFRDVQITANALCNRWASLNGYGAKVQATTINVAPPRPTLSDEEARERAEAFRRIAEE